MTDSMYPTMEEGYFMLDTLSSILHMDDDSNPFMDLINYSEGPDEDSILWEKYSSRLDENGEEVCDLEDENIEQNTSFQDKKVAEVIRRLIEEDRRLDFEADMKECECCRGYINSCRGEMCKKLGACSCIVQAEIETQHSENAEIRRGNLCGCGKEEGSKAGVCFCFNPPLEALHK